MVWVTERNQKRQQPSIEAVMGLGPRWWQGKEHPDSGSLLKVEPTGLARGWDVGCAETTPRIWPGHLEGWRFR